MQETDTTLLGLSPQDATKAPYIASMGVYVFKTDILLKLLRWRYPTSNDFGSEIIPSAVVEQNVQVRNETLTIWLFFRQICSSIVHHGVRASPYV